LTLREAWGLSQAMRGTLAHVFRTNLRPAIRRVVMSLVMLCLAFGPLAGALSAHHVDDGDVVIALSDGASQDVVIVKKAPDHPANLPFVDHDCHGCSTAMIDVPADVAPMYLQLPVQAPPVHLVEGRVPGADFRPPKA